MSTSAATPRTRPAVTGTTVAVIVAYVVAGTVALLLEAPAKGWAVLAVSVGSCVGLVVVARAEQRRDWLLALGVIIPISIFQVFPDWLLSAGVGTLAFPVTGGVRVGHAIPLAMAGMWALPLFLVVLVAEDRIGRGALAALGIFLVTELAAPALQLWKPAGDVTKALGVAIYVLPAEAVLGAATVLAVRLARDRSLGIRLLAAAGVSTLYTGALVLSWFLIDRADWALSV